MDTASCHSKFPVHHAVRQGNLEMVGSFIQHGCDIDQMDGSQATPLGLSMLTDGRQSICELLLRNGSWNSVQVWLTLQELKKSLLHRVTPETGDTFSDLLTTYRLTPFLIAVWAGLINTLNYLVSVCEDIKSTCDIIGGPVHLAVESKNIEVLQRVIELGCDIDLVNNQGNTALHHAARLPTSELCNLLIRSGAHLNKVDKHGETALSSSVYFGQEENAISLIQHGADLNIADCRGTTPLYWSIFNSRPVILQKLIDAGLNVSRMTLTRYPRNLRIMKNTLFMEWLENKLCQPKQLQHLCQLRIRDLCRQASHGKSFSMVLEKLPLPRPILTSVIMI